MGLDTVLECENYCRVGQIPNIGPKVEERDRAEGIPTSRSYLLKNLDEGFVEFGLGNSPSLSHKSTPFGPIEVTDNEELKRGSIYKSSKSVRKLKKLGVLEERRKRPSSRSSDTALSYTIIDSLSRPCASPNEASPLTQQRRSPLISLNADLNSTSTGASHIVPNSPEFLDLSFHLPGEDTSADNLCTGFVMAGDSSSDNFLEICLHSEDTQRCCTEVVAEPAERGSLEEPKFKFDQKVAPQSDGNGLSERERVLTLPKSLSMKVGMLDSPSQLESNWSKFSPKARVTPLRRILNPIMKSKSLRNPSVSKTEVGDLMTISSANIERNRAFCKSLLHDFSKSAQKPEYDGQLVKKDHGSVMATSPAHLHGLLKLEYKNGVPFFEFSLKDPDDFLAAKTWRTDNAFKWVYTFHSGSHKKSNIGGWGTKDRHKQSPIIGQMQVSCYLCSEMRKDGSLDNSTVTEFVLYDISHARKSFAAKESSHCSPNSFRSPNGMVGDGESLVKDMTPFESKAVSEQQKRKIPIRHAFGNGTQDASYPLVPKDLHPHLEIAAIEIHVPFEKSQSLKDKFGAKESSNSSDFSTIDQRSDVNVTSINPANVKVVTPSGAHGLPTTEEGGPSPLLNRWRSGGGCDCGGWDMACPIVVFNNQPVENAADSHPFTEDQRPLELFIQGAKEKMPALTITAVDGGQYSVDFHAQLSALQAFSICVALLHGTAVGQERNGQRLRCNSLKVLLGEEVRCLIEAVAEEEKRKTAKRTEEIPPSFALDPPFSPIGRA